MTRGKDDRAHPQARHGEPEVTTKVAGGRGLDRRRFLGLAIAAGAAIAIGPDVAVPRTIRGPGGARWIGHC